VQACNKKGIHKRVSLNCLMHSASSLREKNERNNFFIMRQQTRLHPDFHTILHGFSFKLSLRIIEPGT
jgi:hypothetical protein